MDNIGYALDNFNAVGEWRDQEEGKSIDVLGQLSSGKDSMVSQNYKAFYMRTKFKPSIDLSSKTFNLWSGARSYLQRSHSGR